MTKVEQPVIVEFGRCDILGLFDGQVSFEFALHYEVVAVSGFSDYAVSVCCFGVFRESGKKGVVFRAGCVRAVV